MKICVSPISGALIALSFATPTYAQFPGQEQICFKVFRNVGSATPTYTSSLSNAETLEDIPASWVQAIQNHNTLVVDKTFNGSAIQGSFYQGVNETPLDFVFENVGSFYVFAITNMTFMQESNTIPAPAGFINETRLLFGNSGTNPVNPTENIYYSNGEFPNVCSVFPAYNFLFWGVYGQNYDEFFQASHICATNNQSLDPGGPSAVGSVIFVTLGEISVLTASGIINSSWTQPGFQYMNPNGNYNAPTPLNYCAFDLFSGDTTQPSDWEYDGKYTLSLTTPDQSFYAMCFPQHEESYTSGGQTNTQANNMNGLTFGDLSTGGKIIYYQSYFVSTYAGPFVSDPLLDPLPNKITTIINTSNIFSLTRDDIIASMAPIAVRGYDIFPQLALTQVSESYGKFATFGPNEFYKNSVPIQKPLIIFDRYQLSVPAIILNGSGHSSTDPVPYTSGYVALSIGTFKIKQGFSSNFILPNFPFYQNPKDAAPGYMSPLRGLDAVLILSTSNYFIYGMIFNSYQNVWNPPNSTPYPSGALFQISKDTINAYASVKNVTPNPLNANGLYQMPICYDKKNDRVLGLTQGVNTDENFNIAPIVFKFSRNYLSGAPAKNLAIAGHRGYNGVIGNFLGYRK